MHGCCNQHFLIDLKRTMRTPPPDSIMYREHDTPATAEIDASPHRSVRELRTNFEPGMAKSNVGQKQQRQQDSKTAQPHQRYKSFVPAPPPELTEEPTHKVEQSETHGPTFPSSLASITTYPCYFKESSRASTRPSVGEHTPKHGEDAFDMLASQITTQEKPTLFPANRPLDGIYFSKSATLLSETLNVRSVQTITNPYTLPKRPKPRGRMVAERIEQLSRSFHSPCSTTCETDSVQKVLSYDINVFQGYSGRETVIDDPDKRAGPSTPQPFEKVVPDATPQSLATAATQSSSSDRAEQSPSPESDELHAFVVDDDDVVVDLSGASAPSEPFTEDATSVESILEELSCLESAGAKVSQTLTAGDSCNPPQTLLSKSHRTESPQEKPWNPSSIDSPNAVTSHVWTPQTPATSSDQSPIQAVKLSPLFRASQRMSLLPLSRTRAMPPLSPPRLVVRDSPRLKQDRGCHGSIMSPATMTGYPQCLSSEGHGMHTPLDHEEYGSDATDTNNNSLGDAWPDGYDHENEEGWSSKDDASSVSGHDPTTAERRASSGGHERGSPQDGWLDRSEGAASSRLLTGRPWASPLRQSPQSPLLLPAKPPDAYTPHTTDVSTVRGSMASRGDVTGQLSSSHPTRGSGVNQSAMFVSATEATHEDLYPPGRWESLSEHKTASFSSGSDHSIDRLSDRILADFLNDSDSDTVSPSRFTPWFRRRAPPPPALLDTLCRWEGCLPRTSVPLEEDIAMSSPHDRTVAPPRRPRAWYRLRRPRRKPRSNPMVRVDPTPLIADEGGRPTAAMEEEVETILVEGVVE